MALLHQGHIHLQRRPYAGQRLAVEDIVARNAEAGSEPNPKLGVAGILSAEKIFALFFDHVLEQHSAQFGYRALLIADTEKAMDIAKFVKLVARPTLQLL